jgi:hypothetical protein
MPSHRAQHKILSFIHIAQFINIAAILGISVYRMMQKTIRTTRNDTMIMGIVRSPCSLFCSPVSSFVPAKTESPTQAAKGIIIMAYMIYTEKCHNIKRFSSIKANFILACTEIVFWIAGAVLPIMNVSQCQAGTGCLLTYILIGLAITNA